MIGLMLPTVISWMFPIATQNLGYNLYEIFLKRDEIPNYSLHDFSWLDEILAAQHLERRLLYMRKTCRSPLNNKDSL
ncbi:hypothetical protein H5410_021846, partial [Solanum commersonii]